MRIFILDKKQVGLLLIAWLLISLLLFFQLMITEWFRPELFNFSQILGYPLTRFIIGCFTILFIIIPAYNYLKVFKTFKKAIGYLLIGFTFVLSYSILSVIAILGINSELSMEALLPSVIEEILTSQHHIITYYLMLISILLVIDFMKDKVKDIQEKENLERELSQTKFLVLKNQIQPHFLFNALNGISSILEEKKESAQDMIADLSQLLRSSIQIDFEKKVKLVQELEILNSYLNIEEKRFEHQLHVKRSIDPNSLDFMILPFILQPIVENAIKHGFTSRFKKIELIIITKLVQNQLLITIKNNGRPIEKSDFGIGLENLYARLKTQYKDRFSYTLKQDNEWVVNQIQINP